MTDGHLEAAAAKLRQAAAVLEVNGLKPLEDAASVGLSALYELGNNLQHAGELINAAGGQAATGLLQEVGGLHNLVDDLSNYVHHVMNATGEMQGTLEYVRGHIGQAANQVLASGS